MAKKVAKPKKPGTTKPGVPIPTGCKPGKVVPTGCKPKASKKR